MAAGSKKTVRVVPRPAWNSSARFPNAGRKLPGGPASHPWQAPSQAAGGGQKTETEGQAGRGKENYLQVSSSSGVVERNTQGWSRGQEMSEREAVASGGDQQQIEIGKEEAAGESEIGKAEAAGVSESGERGQIELVDLQAEMEEIQAAQAAAAEKVRAAREMVRVAREIGRGQRQVACEGPQNQGMESAWERGQSREREGSRMVQQAEVESWEAEADSDAERDEILAAQAAAAEKVRAAREAAMAAREIGRGQRRCAREGPGRRQLQLSWESERERWEVDKRLWEAEKRQLGSVIAGLEAQLGAAKDECAGLSSDLAELKAAHERSKVELVQAREELRMRQQSDERFREQAKRDLKTERYNWCREVARNKDLAEKKDAACKELEEKDKILGLYKNRFDAEELTKVIRQVTGRQGVKLHKVIGRGSFGVVYAAEMSPGCFASCKVVFGSKGIRMCNKEGKMHKRLREIFDGRLSYIDANPVTEYFFDGTGVYPVTGQEITWVFTELGDCSLRDLAGRLLKTIGDRGIGREAKREAASRFTLLLRKAIQRVEDLRYGNVVHFDLKPCNMVVKSVKGADGQMMDDVKLIDVGSAVILPEDDSAPQPLVRHAEYICPTTPMFSQPEAVRDPKLRTGGCWEGQLDCSWDMWAMAVSILDLLGLGCLAGETERMQRERLVRWAKASPDDRESMFCKVEQRISSEFPELKDFGIPDIVQEVVMESMQA